MNFTMKRCVALLGLAALAIGAATGIRVLAQSANSKSNAAPGYDLSRYYAEEFEAPARYVEVLQSAKDYRLKSPYTSRDPATAAGVANAFSYLDKK